MSRLPVLSGAEVVKCFQRDGWRVERQRGSHVILIKADHIASLSVPQHKEVAPGTLRSLIRSSGMTMERFCELAQ